MESAGVEAGANMFVAYGVESFGSLAQTAITDQNRRSMVCAENRNLGESILNIDISLLPLSSNCFRERALVGVGDLQLIPTHRSWLDLRQCPLVARHWKI